MRNKTWEDFTKFDSFFDAFGADLRKKWEDKTWEDPLSDKRSSRMSGIVKTNTNEDQSMFNGGHFDM